MKTFPITNFLINLSWKYNDVWTNWKNIVKIQKTPQRFDIKIIFNDMT